MICHEALAKSNLVASMAIKGLLAVLSIDKEIGLIDLANFLCSYYRRYYINTLRQMSNGCSEFI